MPEAYLPQSEDSGPGPGTWGFSVHLFVDINHSLLDPEVRVMTLRRHRAPVGRDPAVGALSLTDPWQTSCDFATLNSPTTDQYPAPDDLPHIHL